MNIAIIGTGNIGKGLARTLAKTAHAVTVSDQSGGTAAAADLSTEGSQVAAAQVAAAVSGADLVILATPFGAAESLAHAADFTSKIVVDVSNPLTADFSGLTVGHTSSAAEEIAKLLPGATLVKAFNTVFAQHYSSGLNVGGRPIQTFVASDDDSARQAVIALAGEIGMEGVNAGPLKNARYLEPIGFMNITFGYLLGRGTDIAPLWASK